MNGIVFERYKTDCPYLDGRDWECATLHVGDMNASVYEKLLTCGWRRSGFIFYQNLCHDCRECRPLKIDVNNFVLSRSQKRVLRINHDLTLSARTFSAGKRDFDLYRKYCEARHLSAEPTVESSFREHFADSPVESRVLRFFLGPKLVGVAWIDVMPQALSSVYFAFDPAFSKRSLGTFSILKQAELCKLLGKKWLHLGFYVKNSQKMNYKSAFSPCYILSDGKWRSADS